MNRPAHVAAAAIFRNADDLNGLAGLVGGSKAAADGIAAMPVFIGHGFVDDSDALRGLRIGVENCTAADDGNAQSREILRRDGVVSSSRRGLAFGRLVAFDLQLFAQV